NSVIREVASYHALQPLSLLMQRLVLTPTKLIAELYKLRAHPGSTSTPEQKKLGPVEQIQVNRRDFPRVLVKLSNSAAAVIVAKNVTVFESRFGHSDRAGLTHSDAVTESTAHKHERARSRAALLDVDDEHRRGQTAEEPANFQLAAHRLVAALA